MNVKILRLKNGTDIICDMERDGDTYYINAPMEIWMESNGKVPKLCMDHWLPIQVIEDNAAVLNHDDILTTMIPNDSLKDYYIHEIEEMNSVLKIKEMADNMTDDEIIESIIALQEGSEATFH